MMLTSLSKRLVTESCFADLKGVPFVAVECLVYINDIEVFVHPGICPQYGGGPGEVGAVDTERKQEGDQPYSP